MPHARWRTSLTSAISHLCIRSAGRSHAPVVPAHTASIEGMVVRYEIVRRRLQQRRLPVFSNPESQRPERRSRYELHLPYTIVLHLGWGGSQGMLYLFASHRATADSCRGYCVIGRNYNLEQPASVLQRFREGNFRTGPKSSGVATPQTVSHSILRTNYT